MKTKVVACALLIMAPPLFSGCATVVRGSSEELSVQSTPAGAEVKLSTGQSGVTPVVIPVKRRDDITVTIKKAGYKPFETTVISSIDGASLGVGTAANLIFLPIVNDIVDYKTGANYSHKPNPLVVTLIPEDSTADYPLTTQHDSTSEGSSDDSSSSKEASSSDGAPSEEVGTTAEPRLQQGV